MTKYALFTYSIGNIGDDIQSLAARRFLPQVDYMVNRDYMNDFHPDTDEEIKLIMNGWYSHHPENFPPYIPQLTPLLLSMYIDEKSKESFSRPESRDLLTAYGPGGGRSYDTVQFMDELSGGDSYFSGCLTLTLQAEPNIPKQDFILATDLPNDVFKELEENSDLAILRMGADVCHRYMKPWQRLKVAQYFLYLYQSARLVVTTRLHATLPCLALGTPVLNIEMPNFEPRRFEGLRELAHHLTIQEFLEGQYDVNHPVPNPEDYLLIRQDLEKRCEAYTGYKSEEGFLNGQELQSFLIAPELLQSLATGLWTAHHFYGVYR